MDATSMRRAIARKRDGEPLEDGLWEAVTAAYLAGAVDDAQLAALLMAAVLRGLTPDETLALTRAFVASGETLRPAAPFVLDKHSTGGVGDTASLVVVPLVAACGVPVAKLSGRALGHTGGTLDKLEAVPGVRTDLSPEAFDACVRDVGCAIAAQSERLVPADKRVYALRDRTATVPSLGLIAASIVSKKIAGGAHAIVYDVKCGRGAFLPDEPEARALAERLVDTTAAFGRTATALVTDMDEPLGPAAGTGLEVIEARAFLSGERRDARLGAVAGALARAMLAQAGVPDADARLAAALDGGAAFATFERLLARLGAAPDALAALAPAAASATARAPHAGIVTAIDAVALGELARTLVEHHGPGAGLVLRARAGDAVPAAGDLVTVFGDPTAADAAAAAFSIGEAAPAARPLVYGEIVSRSGAAAPSPAVASGARSTLETR